MFGNRQKQVLIKIMVDPNEIDKELDKEGLAPMLPGVDSNQQSDQPDQNQEQEEQTESPQESQAEDLLGEDSMDLNKLPSRPSFRDRVKIEMLKQKKGLNKKPV